MSWFHRHLSSFGFGFLRLCIGVVVLWFLLSCVSLSYGLVSLLWFFVFGSFVLRLEAKWVTGLGACQLHCRSHVVRCLSTQRCVCFEKLGLFGSWLMIMFAVLWFFGFSEFVWGLLSRVSLRSAFLLASSVFVFFLGLAGLSRFRYYRSFR